MQFWQTLAQTWKSKVERFLAKRQGRMNRFEEITSRVKQLIRYLTSGWRRKALVVFFILLSLAVITQVVVANWELLVAYEWNIRPVWLAYALGFFLAAFLTSLWAWHVLVANLAGFDNFRRSSKIYLTSNLARRVPGSIWHITSRALLYGEAGVSKRSISVLSGLEMIFFLVSGVVTVLLAIPFWGLPSQIGGSVDPVWFLVVALPVGLALVHPKLLATLWQRISKEQLSRRLLWRDTVVWLAYYVMTWVLGAAVLFCVINFFEPIPTEQFLPVMGMWALAGTISVVGFLTISLIGLREISLVFLLAQLVPHPITLIIAIAIRLIWLTGELVTSLLALKL